MIRCHVTLNSIEKDISEFKYLVEFYISPREMNMFGNIGILRCNFLFITMVLSVLSKIYLTSL